VVRAPLPHLAALICGFVAALVVAGCGADRSNLIPAGSASTLSAQLTDIKSAIDAGECDGLASKVKAFHDDATGLDGSVDKRLRTRLRLGANSLSAHAVEDCVTTQEQQSETDTVDTTTTETVPDTTTTETQTETATVPTDTTTTPTTSVPTTTTPPDTTTTPDDGTGDTGGTDTGTVEPDVGGTSGEEQLP
jgi:hypothetical protein